MPDPTNKPPVPPPQPAAAGNPRPGPPPAPPPPPRPPVDYSREYGAASRAIQAAGVAAIESFEREAPRVMDLATDLLDFLGGAGEVSAVAGEVAAGADMGETVLTLMAPRPAPVMGAQIARTQYAAAEEFLVCPLCDKRGYAKPGCKVCGGAGVVSAADDLATPEWQ